MSTLTDLYDPGDYIYVRAHTGGVFVYIVQPNGTVVLVSQPED